MIYVVRFSFLTLFNTSSEVNIWFVFDVWSVAFQHIFSGQDDLSQYSTKIDTTRVPAEAKKKADRVAREIELRLSRGGGTEEAKRRMVEKRRMDW